ncbi:MAG: hypothetical protein KBD44_01850 [Candidatus Pacebacteria bacterium]|nr:hypothetical protein [Candidatus Paceibacterota bacterium]
MGINYESIAMGQAVSEHDETANAKRVILTDDSGNIINPEGILSGAGVNGTRALASANTWYSVPSTVPTSPYVLVITIENALGDIRFGFDNTGTPSATNGNIAPSQLTLKLAASQVVYYASTVSGDDVNYSTKEI